MFVSVYRAPSPVEPSEDVRVSTMECHSKITPTSGHLFTQTPFIVFGIVNLHVPAAFRRFPTTEDVEFPIHGDYARTLRR